MKRLLVLVVCLLFASPTFAEKILRFPDSANLGAPATVTISGSPLTVVIGDDTSAQVYNSNVPGTGQFYPPSCAAGETADNGVFVSLGGLIYGPDFDNHPCGSASNSYTPWSAVSMSPVTGTGTAGDPFTVVIVVDAGTTGLRLTETITYVNGAAQYDMALAFSNIGQNPLTWDTFTGADIYLADNDSGYGLLQGTSAGGRAADSSCVQLQYTIILLTPTPADRWSAEGYSTVWSEISAGNLSNVIDATCLDNGAAVQWTGRTLAPGAGLTIDSGVSFAGSAVPLGAEIPTMSTVGLVALIGLLAVVGFLRVRKVSPAA